MLHFENISKSYGDTQALDGINLQVNAGELFGLIGPDGAGKTTLMRILTTLILPDEGQVRLNGLDVTKHYKKIRNLIGYMPGRFSLYQDLSVEENLQFFASVFQTTIAENYELIADIYKQIEPFKDRSAGRLSGGMKQKLALSCALIHKPLVLILDEPTTGVDAVSRMEFWEMLQRLKARGMTIFVSTPYMNEASLCDRIALIQHGRILQTNTPEQIVASYPKKLYAVQADQKFNLLKNLRQYPHAHSVFAFGDAVHLSLEAEELQAEELRLYLEQKGHRNIQIKPVQPGIEDCFMELLQAQKNEEVAHE